MKRSIRKGLVAAAVLAAGALVITGCSSGGTEASDSGGDDSVLIGYATHTLANPFFAGIIKGLENGTSEHGYDFIVANADEDLNQQVTDINDMITKGIDYLFLTPVDGEAITPAIETAQAAGIPVFVLADTVPAPVEATLVSQPDDVGREAARVIVDYLTETKGKPEGKVVDVTGLTGITAASGRTEGFNEVLADYPDIEVVAEQDGKFTAEASNTVMSSILQAQPEIDAIFAANDASAQGVTAAIKAAGRFEPVGEDGHIFIVGSDGSPPGIEAIRNEELDVTVSLNPVKTAETAVDMVAQLEAGETIETQVDEPTFNITLENIESPEAEEYGIWADTVE